MILHLLPWRAGRHSRVRHFGKVFTSPYKNTWSESLHCCAYTLSPADTRLSPQHWLGAAGCNSRAGLVRFPLAQADGELGHRETTRGYAWRFEPSTLIIHISTKWHMHHRHESTIFHQAYCDFAFVIFASRTCLLGANFEYINLQGS